MLSFYSSECDVYQQFVMISDNQKMVAIGTIILTIGHTTK